MIYKYNLIEKLFEYQRILITFSLVLLLSFSYIFHGFSEKIRTKALASQLEYSIDKEDVSEITPQEKWLLDKTDTRNYELRGMDSAQGISNRHKTRWVANYFEIKKTNFLLSNFSPKFAFAFYCLFFSLLISFSYIFCLFTFEHITKKKDIKSSLLFCSAFIFYLYPLYFELQEFFSFHEMLAISACIFFTLKKKIWLFLFFAIVGVLNRETGLLLITFYTFINFKEKLYFLPIFILPSIFIFVNYDLFAQPSFYNIGYWLSPFDTSVFDTTRNFSILNYFGLQYFYSLLLIFIYLFPTLILLFYSKLDKNLKIFLFILFLYIVSLLGGTIITNIFPFIILLPTLLAINSFLIYNK